jgi:hypothetical protein
MKKLRTLTELLKMATEARKVASEPAQMVRLRTLIADMRRAAHDANARQRRAAQKQRDSYTPTRFELCVTGIQEELDFGRRPLSGIDGLEARLSGICHQIERTIKDANTVPQGLINE